MATGPLYIQRSYGGGAVVAQLTQEMGATDTAFSITPTTGWTEEDGAALGTAGPFTIVIDRFTASVEKILCTSINLTTGVVQVYNSGGFSGRGYDGTVPQAHVPGGSPSGVQTCWSSIEAFEANGAVKYVLGTAGGTRTPGAFMSLDGSGNPIWTAGSLIAGPLATHSYAPSSEVSYTLGGSFVVLDGTNLVTTPFVVPASGAVIVRFSALAAVTSGGAYQIGLMESGSQVGPAVILSNPTVNIAARLEAAIKVTSLTPATTHNFAIAGGSFLGFATTVYAGGNGTGGNVTNNAGPALITVEAA